MIFLGLVHNVRRNVITISKCTHLPNQERAFAAAVATWASGWAAAVGAGLAEAARRAGWAGVAGQVALPGTRP